MFDNAPNHEAIEAFLPLQQGHVLITSRDIDCSWAHTTQTLVPLVVPPFVEEEVMALATQLDCSVAPKDEVTPHYLLEKMSGHPLALVQFLSLCKVLGCSPADCVEKLKGKRPLPQDGERLLEEAPNANANISQVQRILEMLHMSIKQLDDEKRKNF